VPRRRTADDGSIDLDDFMIEVNETVVNRGVVLADGQIVKKPFNCGIGGYELFGDSSAFETPGRTWVVVRGVSWLWAGTYSGGGVVTGRM
jgi:hypothetical protein